MENITKYVLVLTFFVYLSFITNGREYIGPIETQGPNWEWAKISTNTGISTFVTHDALGNTYAWGTFTSSTVTFGGVTIHTTDAIDYPNHLTSSYIVKYDSNGNVIWAKSLGGRGVNIKSIIADASGNIYLTGTFAVPSVRFGSIILFNANTKDKMYSDMFLVKYNTDGNVIWAKSEGGDFDDFPKFLTADASGNIYLIGTFYSPSISFDSTTLVNLNYRINNGRNTSLISALLFDVPPKRIYYPTDFMVKYNTNGQMVWAKITGTDQRYVAQSICVGNSGNIYVVGYLRVYRARRRAHDEMFVQKYDTGGYISWTKIVRRGKKEVAASCVTTDASDNVYVSGSFSSRLLRFDSLELKNKHKKNDVFLVKYNTDGKALWVTGVGKKELRCGIRSSWCVHDTMNNIYMAEFFPEAAGMTPELNNLNNVFYGFLIEKYNANGNLLWTKSILGTYLKPPRRFYSLMGIYSITINALGNLFVTGYFKNSSLNFDSIKLTNPEKSARTYIAKLSLNNTLK